MEQRLSIVTLGVSDLLRSRDFYERLGWRRSMAKSEGVVFFQAGGIALALYPRDELAKDANVAAEGSEFSGFSLAYNARTREEVDEVLGQAQAAGAKVLKPGQEAFGEVTPDTFPIPMVSCGKWRGIPFFRSARMEHFKFRTEIAKASLRGAY